jgi:hypothetical protein
MQRFSKFMQIGDDRVILTEDHPVIELFVDPTTDHIFDIREIDDHPAVIEFVGLERNDNSTIVAVKMTALSLIVQKTMSIAKVNFSCHKIHDKSKRDARLGSIEVKPFG